MTENTKNEKGRIKIRVHRPIFGTPITFLDKYNPKQFEIVGLDRYVEDNPHYGHRFTIVGKETYARILIKKLSCELKS